jgi:hypothetical protein
MASVLSGAGGISAEFPTGGATRRFLAAFWLGGCNPRSIRYPRVWFRVRLLFLRELDGA